MKNTAHLILQGKGGVGKSMIASMLAQYMIERGFSPTCGDTDPVNSTFHQISSLNVSLIPISEGGVVLQRLFDPLFESMINIEDPSIIDNGASTFLPMVKFIKSNGIFEILEQFNKKVFIHSIITGGQAKDDTATGLLALIDTLKETKSNAKIVVWKNEFWGVPVFKEKQLEEMPWIRNNKDIISGIVTIIDRNSDAFSTDLKLMSENHMTYNDVKESEEFGLLAKSRIFRVFKDIYEQLDLIFNTTLKDEKKQNG